MFLGKAVVADCVVLVACVKRKIIGHVNISFLIQHCNSFLCFFFYSPYNAFDCEFRFCMMTVISKRNRELKMALPQSPSTIVTRDLQLIGYNHRHVARLRMG